MLVLKGRYKKKFCSKNTKSPQIIEIGQKTLGFGYLTRIFKMTHFLKSPLNFSQKIRKSAITRVVFELAKRFFQVI